MRGGCILRPFNDRGYLRVELNRIGKSAKYAIHRLVAEAFIGPAPAGLLVLHRDDDSSNNTPDNLYYGTPKDNGADKVRNGTSLRGTRHHAVTITAERAKAISLWADKLPMVRVAEKFGVSIQIVSHIKHGHAWNHVTGKAVRR